MRNGGNECCASCTSRVQRRDSGRYCSDTESPRRAPGFCGGYPHRVRIVPPQNPGPRLALSSARLVDCFTSWVLADERASAVAGTRTPQAPTGAQRRSRDHNCTRAFGGLTNEVSDSSRDEQSESLGVLFLIATASLITIPTVVQLGPATHGSLRSPFVLHEAAQRAASCYSNRSSCRAARLA